MADDTDADQIVVGEEIEIWRLDQDPSSKTFDTPDKAFAEAQRLIEESVRRKATVLNVQLRYLERIPDEIAACAGLQTLNLRGTQVADPSPLAGCTGLQALYLSNTQVADLSPLGGCTGLQVLYLNSTQVADLGPLAACTGLQALNLSNTQVVDLGPLAGCTGLQALSLSNTQVADLGPLAGCTSLQELYLDDTQVADLGPLALITSLSDASMENQYIGLSIDDMPAIVGKLKIVAGYGNPKRTVDAINLLRRDRTPPLPPYYPPGYLDDEGPDAETNEGPLSPRQVPSQVAGGVILETDETANRISLPKGIEAQPTADQRLLYAELRRQTDLLVRECARNPNRLKLLGELATQLVSAIAPNGEIDQIDVLWARANVVRRQYERDLDNRNKPADEQDPPAIPADIFGLLEAVSETIERLVSREPRVAVYEGAGASSIKEDVAEAIAAESGPIIDAMKASSQTVDPILPEVLKQTAEAGKGNTPSAKKARTFTARSVVNVVLTAVRSAAMFTAKVVGAAGAIAGAAFGIVKAVPPVMAFIAQYQHIINDLLKLLPGGERLIELVKRLMEMWFR